MTIDEVKEAAINLLRNHEIDPNLPTILVGDPNVNMAIRTGFMDALIEHGCTGFDIMSIPPPAYPGEEPTSYDFKEKREGKTASDVIAEYSTGIFLTSASISHITGSKAIIDKPEGYIISIPGIDEGVVNTLKADPAKVKKIDDALETAIGSGPNTVEIFSEAGTELRMRTPKGNWGGESGLRETSFHGTNGVFGEYFTGPVIGSTQGIYVLPPNSCLTTPIGMTTEEVKLVIANGMVVQILGGKEADTLKAMLLEAYGKTKSPFVWQVAEFAFGTNPTAPREGKSVCVEKALGGNHIAIGTNTVTMKKGRKSLIPGVLPQNVGIHVDAITFGNTVVVDGKKVMENGELLI